jgi:putative glutamine amidotransferase
MTAHVELDEVLPEPRGDADGPRVAVLVSLNFPDLTEPVADLVRRFTRTALQELEDRGARWHLVDTSAPLPSTEDALDADAVLLLGGGDVDTELYGVAGPAPHEYGVDVEADRFCVDVIRDAVDRDIPVLGICRGSQLVNVAFGGTLVPDISDFALHHGVHDADLFVDEEVLVREGTRLRSVLACESLVVRTGHHQAVADVAPSLRLAAVAHDGVVEGIEHPEAWVVGVQWHPEDTDGPSGPRESLFGALLDAARERHSG